MARRGSRRKGTTHVYRRGIAGVVGAVAMLAGCGAAQAPTCDLPSDVNLTVQASDRLNPDDRGRSLPTVVRIFQVTEIGTIETARFEELWQKPEEVMGDALVGKDQLTIYPDRTMKRAFERNPEANYLVGVGLFRRPAGVTWRTILELPPTPTEQQCAAATQGDEEAGPPAVPRVVLMLEDYRMRGQLEAVRRAQCDGVACLDVSAEDAKGAADNAPQPEGPQAPSGP